MGSGEEQKGTLRIILAIYASILSPKPRAVLGFFVDLLSPGDSMKR